MGYRYTWPLLFSFALPALGQTPFEYADQRTQTVGYKGCARAGQTWVAIGSAGDESGIYTYHFAQAFTSQGEPLWSTALFGQDWFGIAEQIIATDTNSVLIAGPHDGCDVLSPFSYLARVTENGSLAWTKSYAIPYINRMEAAADGRLLLSNGSDVLVVNATGDSLTSFSTQDSLGWPSVMSAVWDGDSSVLSYRYTGIVERRTLQAELLASNATGLSIQDLIHWRDHRLVLAANGTIHRLNDQLLILDSIPLQLGSLGRFVPKQNTLWVIGNDHGVELDTLLNTIRTVDLDPNAVFGSGGFYGYAVDADTIGMAGYAPTAQRPAGILRTVVADGTVPDPFEDVAITIESIDSTWYTYSAGVVYPRVAITVRVTNEGNGILDSVTVMHNPGISWICSSVGTTVHLNGIGLAPGEWTTTQMQDLWLPYAPWDFVNLHPQICIGALSPNNIYDRDQSDNLACDTAHIVLGVPEMDQHRPGVLLINPFADQLEGSLVSPLRSPAVVSLFDVQGRALIAVQLPQGISRFTMNTQSLADGPYLLTLEMNGQRVTRSVIKRTW